MKETSIACKTSIYSTTVQAAQRDIFEQVSLWISLRHGIPMLLQAWRYITAFCTFLLQGSIYFQFSTKTDDLWLTWAVLTEVNPEVFK